MPLYENRPSPARHDVKIDRRQRLLRVRNYSLPIPVLGATAFRRHAVKVRAFLETTLQPPGSAEVALDEESPHGASRPTKGCVMRCQRSILLDVW